MKALMQEQTSRQVEALLQAQSGSFIFHGARGVGKAHTAYELARQLNCLGDNPATCSPCLQLAAGNYPDLITVRPEDKPSILIEQVRGLVQALSYSLYHPNGMRIVVVDDAHMLTIEAQNALLKLIEEPPARTIFTLITDQPAKLLPTVQSRCGAIYFPRIPDDQIEKLLVQRYNIKPSEASPLAEAAEGAPGIAVMLATKPEQAQSRLELSSLVAAAASRATFDRLILAKRLSDSKADLPGFGRMLHRGIIKQISAGTADVLAAARQLDALENFRRALQAKVAPRVAVERLMLEL